MHPARKEVSARTARMQPGIPISILISVHADGYLHFHHQDATDLVIQLEGGRYREGDRLRVSLV
jgi:hypothetical protein